VTDVVLEEIDERDVECEVCSTVGTVDVRVTTFGGETLLNPAPPGEEDGEAFHRVDGEVLCSGCRDRRRELERSDVVTVPEPPSEWRFCQECGEQIDVSRLNGRFCAECDETAGEEVRGREAADR